jgi:hypothetical protein
MPPDKSASRRPTSGYGVARERSTTSLHIQHDQDFEAWMWIPNEGKPQ